MKTTSLAIAGLAAAAALAAPAAAAPLPADAAAAVTAITTGPRYANSTWGIAVADAVTGESLNAQNAPQMFVPGSITKAFSAAAALETIGPDRRFRTPVHRLGRLRDGVLRGNLVLVAQGDFSFGLRETPGGGLSYADGGADHNEANSLGFVQSVSGNPLRALNRLAADVRTAGVRQVDGDVVIDDRLFETYSGWPDGVIAPIWVNENLIDITVTPGASGRAARISYRPRTAAYRVVGRVTTTPSGSDPNLQLDEPRPGTIRIQGTMPQGPSTVRVWQVSDPAAFARTAFIEALQRQGVRVSAKATGENPKDKLPRSRTYPDATRLGVWTSPTFDKFVNVVLKVSYNRGADLLACLVGADARLRECEDGLARVTQVVRGMGVPGEQFFNFDGAGSDDRNHVTPNALNALMKAASTRPWGQLFRADLPVLGEPGGGDLAVFGTTLPSRGKLQAKTGTRAGGPPGATAGLLGSRGLSGYLTGASGRQMLITVIMNNMPFASFDDLFSVIGDQVNIVNTVYAGS